MVECSRYTNCRYLKGIGSLLAARFLLYSCAFRPTFRINNLMLVIRTVLKEAAAGGRRAVDNTMGILVETKSTETTACKTQQEIHFDDLGEALDYLPSRSISKQPSSES